MGEQATAHDGATVAAYDIARLAGVGRAAVSNWRRRYSDFPQPVGGSAASPRYALADVEAWLSAHGRQLQVSPADRVWQRIRGVVEDLHLGELIGHVGVCLVVAQRAPRRWRQLAAGADATLANALAAAVEQVAPEVPEAVDPPAPEWAAVLRLAVEAAADEGHREVFDAVCDRFLEIHARRRRIPGDVAEAIVAVAGADAGTVLDPACEVGSLLLAAHGAGAHLAWGQEPDLNAARLAAVRLLLHGATARVRAGDSLRADAFAGQLADAVVCSPALPERSWGYDELASDPRWEYGLPPRGEPELAWLQHCLSRVAPAGRVAIVMPAGAASRRPGRRIRSNLLRAGALRAVITLSGPGPGTAGAPDLWLLRRPAPGVPSPSHVLLADATDDPAAAVAAWQAFDTDCQQVNGTGRIMRIIDLLDDEVDLSPSRQLAVPAVDAGASFPGMAGALRDLARRLADGPPSLAQATPPAPVPEVTLGELVRAGVVAVLQAPLRMSTEGGAVPVLTVRDVRHRRGPSGHTDDNAGLVELEAGDVVVPAAAREPAAVVIAEGGGVLGPQLHLLRADPERLDPYFLAGCLRAALSQPGHSSRSSRSDIARVTLPRMPVAEQRRYGEAFSQLAALEHTARQLASLADSLVGQGLAGLATGSLQPLAAQP